MAKSINDPIIPVFDGSDFENEVQESPVEIESSPRKPLPTPSKSLPKDLIAKARETAFEILNVLVEMQGDDIEIPLPLTNIVELLGITIESAKENAISISNNNVVFKVKNYSEEETPNVKERLAHLLGVYLSDETSGDYSDEAKLPENQDKFVKAFVISLLLPDVDITDLKLSPAEFIQYSRKYHIPIPTLKTSLSTML